MILKNEKPNNERMKDQTNHINQENHSSDNLQPFCNTTIPSDWKELKVKDVATIKGGYAFDSLKFRESGKYQVVKMSNVYDNILDLNRSKSFLENLSEQEKEFIIKKDDIIITLTGTIGKRDYGYSYQIKNESNLLLNQRIAKISVNSADSKYLFYEVKTNRFLNQFFLSARGGTGNSPRTTRHRPRPKFDGLRHQPKQPTHCPKRTSQKMADAKFIDR